MNRNLLLIVLTCLLPATGAWAQLRNPLINHIYTADPSARVFGDVLWLYPSHDRDDATSFSMEDYHAFSTTDMQTWHDHGVIFNPLRQTMWAKSAAWAPDCVERNGRYYLYYPTDKRHIGVAVGDTPYGPFSDPLGKPLVSIDSPGVVCDRDFIDPAVLLDGDDAYLFMGQNTVCCVKLNDDMISYDGEVQVVEGARDFFEAIWVHKRGDTYYMSYSDGPFRGHEPRIVYATASHPVGPYTYRGVILDPVSSGTNHHSIVNYRGQDYLFYHTADLSGALAPGYHCGVRRSVCADSLFYEADGSIREVRPTVDSTRLRIDSVPAARRAQLIAGSVRQPKFPAAADTLSGPQTLQSLQTAIDHRAAEGGGVVVLPAGEHRMDGSLELKSNVRLHLSDGCTLIFSDNPDHYLPPTLSRWEGIELYNRRSMIHAEGQDNTAITGEGNAVINANGGRMARWGMPTGEEEFEENVHGTHGETPETDDVERLRSMGEQLTPVESRVFGGEARLRPCAVEFSNCTRVLLEGITLQDSPFWCIHPLYCSDVTVRRVTIRSHFPNNDGCDPESSRRVLIEDCLFDTGDDAVAIKSGRDADGRRVARPSEDIVIRRCKFYSRCNGLCIGSEMSGGVNGVYMSQIEIGDVKNALLFKSNLDRGGYIDNVWVDSVTIGRAAGAVLRFETNYFGYRGGHFPARYSNFDISNVTAVGADAFAIYFDGNEDEPIRNINVENFTVGSAPRPYYMYQTRDCLFRNCHVGDQQLPLRLNESVERQQCDVW